MGSQIYPTSSTVATTSTVLPTGASSVILDGALTSSTSYTTTINGNGGPVILTAGMNDVNFTVNSTYNVVAAGTSTTVPGVGSSASVTVAACGTGDPTSSWTSATMPSSAQWQYMSYINGTFVCISGQGNQTFATSNNGYTWTARANFYGPYGPNGKIRNINGRLIICINTNYNGNIWTSTDGINWTAIAANAPLYRPSYIEYTNGKYVAIGYNSNSNIVSSYSYNLYSWSAAVSLPAGIYEPVSGNGVIVAGTTTGNQLFVSSNNGVSWSTITAGNGGEYWTTLVYGNGVFLGFSASPTSSAAWIRSTDGINWTYYPNSLYLSATQTNYASFWNNYFVVNPTYASSIYSTDGLSWTAMNSRPNETSCLYTAPAYGIGSGNNIPTWISCDTLNPSAQAAYMNPSIKMPATFGIYQTSKTVN